ncbi:hypothetical protein [Chryseobacterium hagamense]|uniref:hypothetical protein n=1 Tax=Chryseobacterium hagamense TaxID=395935 RepID=UPI0011BEB6BC|nr:hypothetical protein [Chryseobacterium hagamense]
MSIQGGEKQATTTGKKREATGSLYLTDRTQHSPPVSEPERLISASIRNFTVKEPTLGRMASDVKLNYLFNPTHRYIF